MVNLKKKLRLICPSPPRKTSFPQLRQLFSPQLSGNVNDYVVHIYRKYAELDGNNKTKG